MTTMKVVDRKTFGLVINEITDNSDFFDPLYLEDPEIFSPIKEEDIDPLYSLMFEDEITKGILTLDEIWTVIDFLQSYSDVDLLEYAKVERHNRLRRRDTIDTWYAMYVGEALGASAFL